MNPRINQKRNITKNEHDRNETKKEKEIVEYFLEYFGNIVITPLL